MKEPSQAGLKGFDYMTLDEAYEQLDNLPSQTYVAMGEGVKLKRKANGIPVARIHYSAIPERNESLNPEWVRSEKAKFAINNWNREQEIDDQAGGGDKLFASLLSMFKEKIIITDPRWFPEPEWHCYGGFDHGKTNATTLEKSYVDHKGNIIACGEFYRMKTPGWDNQVWQNIPELLQMPHLDKMVWCRADPSIFYDKELQADGSYTNINNIYRRNGFKALTTFPTSIPREDLTFEERLNDHWKNLTEFNPTLYIVCRNYLDRRQPGLHPWDNPNLLWELWRMRRAELTGLQLMSRNPTEKIIDKDNHAWDAFKYLVMSLPKATPIPLASKIKEILETLNPSSAQIRIQQVISQEKSSSTNKPLNMMRRPVIRR